MLSTGQTVFVLSETLQCGLGHVGTLENIKIFIENLGTFLKGYVHLLLDMDFDKKKCVFWKDKRKGFEFTSPCTMSNT